MQKGLYQSNVTSSLAYIHGQVTKHTTVKWPIDSCHIKIYADQYHMIILRAQVLSSSNLCVFFKLTTDQVLVFDWIAGSCLVDLFKTGQDCSEAGQR